MTPDLIELGSPSPWAVLPPGIHDTTLTEVEARFATTPHRKWLFNGFVRMVQALSAAGCRYVYLDVLSGIPRTTAFVFAIYNNGAQFSGSLVGDAQVASNIETGVQAARLYEAWIEHGFAGDRGSLKFGLYDLNTEFDALEASSLFIGSAHGIGTDFSQTGLNGPSIFPSTSLAARLELLPTEGLKMRGAMLDAVPNDPDRPARTLLRLSGREGALFIGEAEYHRSPNRVIAGYWRYSATFIDTLESAKTRSIQTANGNEGYYLRGETRLTDRDNASLNAFARIGRASGRFNDYDLFASAGITQTGLLFGREKDKSGLAFAYARSSQSSRKLAEINGERRGPSEIAFELTHRLVLSEASAIQPNMQYIVSPGADSSVKNALVFWIRFEFGWSSRKSFP